jgi:hypothetical protein
MSDFRRTHGLSNARRLAHTVYVVLAVGLCLYFLVHRAERMAVGAAYYPFDGFIDWGGAKVTLEGHDPYSPQGLAEFGLSPEHGLGHPPTTLVWFFPFAHLSAMEMKQVFSLITLLLLGIHLAVTSYELRLPLWPVTAVLGFCAVYQTDFMYVHLAQVDLSEPIAFLYLMGWFFLRRDREIEAGVFLGLAATLKLYPAILVLFLLPARRLRAFASAGVAYLVVAAEITRHLGLGAFRAFLKQTGGYTDSWMSNIRNASIEGIVHRWFYPVWVNVPDKRVLPLATWVAAALSLFVLVLGWWVSRDALRRAHSRPTEIDLPFALFSILSMAPGPYQWEHYNVTLILPFLLLARCAMDEFARGGRSLTMVIGIALVVVSVFLNVVADDRNAIAVEILHNKSLLPKLLYYEYSAWLPWFILAVLLGVFLYRSRDAVLAQPGSV